MYRKDPKLTPGQYSPLVDHVYKVFEFLVL